MAGKMKVVSVTEVDNNTSAIHFEAPKSPNGSYASMDMVLVGADRELLKVLQPGAEVGLQLPDIQKLNSNPE